MYLSHLSLTNFRCFARLDIPIPRRQVLVLGGNAQGKTTLLEAVYYLATFTSFHIHHDRQLINFVAAREPLAVARLVADYQRGPTNHHMEVRIIQEAGSGGTSARVRKEVYLDGIKRSLADTVGHFNAVIFMPHMARIVEDGPEERRRYLNLTISQASPAYAKALSEYSLALTQRNALLKLLCERGGDAGQLFYWDEIIARRGAEIIQARIGAIQEIERLAARIHQQLTRSQEVMRLVYQPAYDPLPRPVDQFALPLDTDIDRSSLGFERIYQGFIEKLAAVRGEEIARGVTTIGPHRDEMRFLVNGVDLGNYGSRGQVRTTLLALKLAEVGWLKEKTGEMPILLLDEILAELDAERRLDLLNFLTESEQALLTTTDMNLFSGSFIEKAAIWQVNGGKILRSDGQPV